MAITYNPYGWEIRSDKNILQEILKLKQDEFTRELKILETWAFYDEITDSVLNEMDDCLDNLSYSLYEMKKIMAKKSE